MFVMQAPQKVREKIAHPDASALDLATIMHAVGDPLRLDIVRLLREAGVTRTRAEGTQRFISLRRDDLEDRFPGLVEVLTH